MYRRKSAYAVSHHLFESNIQVHQIVLPPPQSRPYSTDSSMYPDPKLWRCNVFYVASEGVPLSSSVVALALPSTPLANVFGDPRVSSCRRRGAKVTSL